MTMIFEFRGIGSDCVSKIYKKDLNELKRLNLVAEKGRFVTYEVKLGKRIYRINKDTFFEILDKLPGTNLVSIDLN